MAVLVEAISIIVLRKAIVERYIGGWNAFTSDVPNKTLCDDGEVVRVGFMDGNDAKLYINKLVSKGLKFIEDELYIDFAVVDQFQGMKLKCDLLEVNNITFLETGISIRKCGLKGSAITSVYLPDGWKYEGSLSQKCTFVPPGQKDSNMEFIRHENGQDVYLDISDLTTTTTGKECYIGRTAK